MDIYYAHRFIILVFCAYIAVPFSEVKANESPEQYVPCNSGWYYFGEKCYNVLPLNSSKGSKWPTASDNCIMEGGNLAIIHSNDLQDFLTVFLMLNSKKNLWIGLHDRSIESIFMWVDGSGLDFSNWDDKEPSNSKNYNEDCVEMRYNSFKNGIGKWNDESCHSEKPYICQINKNDDLKSPDPRYCSIEDGGGWKYLNSCYHIIQDEKSWEDAEKYCEEKYKGYLVTILDDAAETFLNYIMKLSDVSKYVWIGIKVGNDPMQKWTSGWHVGNKKFTQGRSLLFQTGTCVMKTDGKSWGIAPCFHKYPFICEKINYNIPVLQKPPSDDWECPKTGKNWLDLGGHSCYYVENGTSRNWLEANYECGRIGGTLASFLSENETNLLHPHLLETQDRLLIGLRRNSENKDIFEWAGGENLTYQNWNDGEPNSKNEICGELWTSNMKWNDIPCNIAKGYICKTKKMFAMSKHKKPSHHMGHSKRHKHSSGVPAGVAVAIMFCTFLVGLLIGVTTYHYRDYWRRCFTKTERNGYTSPSSLGAVSDKVLWKQEGGHLNY